MSEIQIKLFREKIETMQSGYTGLQNQSDYAAGKWEGYEDILKLLDALTLHDQSGVQP